MIQSQCMRAGVDARPMHEPKKQKQNKKQNKTKNKTKQNHLLMFVKNYKKWL